MYQFSIYVLGSHKLRQGSFRFDLVKEFTDVAPLFSALDSEIGRIFSESGEKITCSVLITGSALEQLTRTETHELNWQIRMTEPGDNYQTVRRGTLQILPALGDVVAIPPTDEGVAEPVLQGIALINMSALRCVCLDDSGNLIYASSDDLTHVARSLGILQTSVVAGAQGTAYLEAAVTESSWAWNTSLPVWLGTGGQLTQVAPTTGFIRQVATVLSPTQIFFEPQEGVLL